MDDKKFLFGVITGVILSNGNISSLILGVGVGWLLTDPETNYLKIKEKLKYLNN